MSKRRRAPRARELLRGHPAHTRENRTSRSPKSIATEHTAAAVLADNDDFSLDRRFELSIYFFRVIK
ncbi:unnamed protein product [Trichogramma brassicae]|uniref:Uncharacterized protein n=1 Tax=Trichogramma brassicae TaxID=86971 RepID=A0A6H5I731_9HYME|nr:unnamed protein product [Trichogramma brassicae]